MKISQVALQLYTLRDFLQTPDDLAATLKKVAAIGYPAVQISGLGPIDPAEVARMLKQNKLVCCATHERPDLIRREPATVVQRLNAYGCRFTAYPYPAGVDWTQPAQLEQLVGDLDHAGSVLRQAGQVLTYHNHAIEFIRVGKAAALDYIYARTDPRNLQAEIDTYWVQFGGGDVAAWCRKLAGRMPLLHMKDYRYTVQDKPTFAPIGQGNLDWHSIIPAAEEAGCDWFIVEQDTCDGDPFDAVRTSFDFIASELLA